MFFFFTITISFYKLEKKSVWFFADEILFIFTKPNKMYQTLVRFLALRSKIRNIGRKSVIWNLKLEKNWTVFIKNNKM